MGRRPHPALGTPALDEYGNPLTCTDGYIGRSERLDAESRKESMLNRRCFLAANRGSDSLVGADSGKQNLSESKLLTRGVVLVPEDLTLADWPERAKAGRADNHRHPPPELAAGGHRLDQDRRRGAIPRSCGISAWRSNTSFMR